MFRTLKYISSDCWIEMIFRKQNCYNDTFFEQNTQFLIKFAREDVRREHSNLQNSRRTHERWDGRISGDRVPSRAQDFREFNIVLGASVDSPEGCNGVLNLRGSQPRISSPSEPTGYARFAVKNSRASNLNCRRRLNLWFRHSSKTQRYTCAGCGRECIPCAFRSKPRCFPHKG